MAAYLIADIQIADVKKYEEYKRRVAPLIERFNGRYVARAGKHAVLEGDWEPTRLVVLEFPDMATLQAWYTSAEYAPVKSIRLEAAESRMIALEGL